MANDIDRTQEVQALWREKEKLNSERDQLKEDRSVLDKKMTAIRQANDGTLTLDEISQLTEAFEKIASKIDSNQDKIWG